MVRRVGKFVWFWGWILALAAPGFFGALDVDNKEARQAYILLSELVMIFVPVIALFSPARVLAMRPKQSLPSWIIGLSAGVCFIADSFIASLFIILVNAIPGISQWEHWPFVPYVSLETGAVLLFFFVGGICVGVLLGWGCGIDLSPLVRRDATIGPISEENVRPAKLRPYVESLERTAVRRRREVVWAIVAAFGLLAALRIGYPATSTHGQYSFLPPGYDGLAVDLFNGFIRFLMAPAIAVGIWYGNRLGLLLRGQLVTFWERIWPHVSLGGTLTALFTGYILSVAFFASCYALTYEHEGPRAFVDQSTHSIPRRNHIQIGDLAVLSLSTLAGGNGSPLQPASPLARGLFLSQVLLNIAWTGGIFLAAASRVVDAKKTSPAAVIVTPLTVQASPPIPPPTLVHVHVTIRERETNAATPAVSAPTTAGSRHVWRALLIMAAAFTLLLRLLKR